MRYPSNWLGKESRSILPMGFPNGIDKTGGSAARPVRRRGEAMMSLLLLEEITCSHYCTKIESCAIVGGRRQSHCHVGQIVNAGLLLLLLLPQGQPLRGKHVGGCVVKYCRCIEA